MVSFRFFSTRKRKRGAPATDRPVKKRPRKPSNHLEFDDEPRSFLRDVHKPPRFSLNGLLIVLCSALLLAFQGLLVISVPDPLAAAFGQDSWVSYSFQLAFAVFLGALLGPSLGVASILIYCLSALLLFPLFAGGGGIGYVLQPGFGYFLGMAYGAYLAGKMIQRALSKTERSGRSLLILLSALMSIFAAHTMGALYLFGLGISGICTWGEAAHWWIEFTGTPILYDVLTAMAMFCLTRFTRLTLWPALYA